MARQGLKTEWEESFLRAFAQGKTVTAAAREVWISRKTIYEQRRHDPEFARRFDEAQRESLRAAQEHDQQALPAIPLAV